MTESRWRHCYPVAYFFGGMFLANSIPHLVAGVSGSSFQSPFADPPGVGLSSSRINVIWAATNLALAWAFVLKIGEFNLRRVSHALPFALGALAIAIGLAEHFGKLHGGAR